MPRRDSTLTTRRKTGRKHALTPRTRDVIIDTLQGGADIVTAVHLAGVSQAAFYRWMERAIAVENLIEAGEPYDPDELVFREFRESVLDARARVTSLMSGVVVKAAVGGYLIEEEPVTEDGKLVRDENGNVVMRRRYAQPDGRLAMQYLSKASPDQWGQNPVSRLEISGPGGGPVQHEGLDSDGLRELTAAMSAVYAQREAQRLALEAGDGEPEPEDVHEAEIVEDGEDE